MGVLAVAIFASVLVYVSPNISKTAWPVEPSLFLFLLQETDTLAAVYRVRRPHHLVGERGLALGSLESGSSRDGREESGTAAYPFSILR